jgi:Acetyltransferase (GNAT) domain
MRYEVVNPLAEPEWNARLLEYRGATVFHTAQWARVLATTYGYQPQYALFREGETVVGLLPIMEVRSLWTGRRGVSLPFSDECAPLLTGGATAPALLELIRDFGMAHRWDYLELRGGVEDVRSATRTDQFVTHNLALEASEEAQLRKLRDSTRRNIHRALKEGVEIHHLQSIDAMDAFYALHCRTRRRHGLPPQPLRFFHQIHQSLIEPGSGFVSLARFNSKWIAGAVFLRFGAQAVYKFGASDPHYQHARANNLVMWQSICRLQREKVGQLSLGRSDRDDQGLLQFKRGWGGEEVDLFYYRIGFLKSPRSSSLRSSNAAGGFSHKIIQRLPIPVLRFVGGVMYRHIG